MLSADPQYLIAPKGAAAEIATFDEGFCTTIGDGEQATRAELGRNGNAHKSDDAPAQLGRNITYLALGDSITWGCGSDAAPQGGASCPADAGGYRIPLIASLESMGHNVTTMGTLRTGPAWAPRRWTLHEGHSGWRIDQVDQILNVSMRTSPTPPSLITIQLGCNDCGQGAPVPGFNPGMANITDVMAARMESLLGHVFEAAPEANVFLGSIIGMPQKAAWVNCSRRFNALLPAMAKQWAAKGMRITYAPVYEWAEVCVSPLSPRPAEQKSAQLRGLCCAGDVHPTAAGICAWRPRSR